MTPTTPSSGAADLRTAAQAVVDRWDTPLWKDVPATAEYIGRLRAALAAGQATAAQVVVAAGPTPELQRMTTSRASFFMERFLHEEKLLGPNEQAALQFVISMLSAQPAAQQGVAYAALPESFLEIPDVQDESGINAYYSREAVLECIDAALASHGQAPADAAPSAGAVAGPDDIDAIALTRYKVVPAHESMFHRFAVVAGDGKQQLYLGREVECENMARKFAGAFLDGAFYQVNITPPTQAADSAQEDALSDAVRVPLDSLHADAAYLIGRLREGSMPYDRVIEIIRERIDAASPTAQAAESAQEDAARYRWLRDETEWEPFDSVWLIKNDIYGCPTLAMDVAIDIARKQGASHDNA